LCLTHVWYCEAERSWESDAKYVRKDQEEKKKMVMGKLLEMDEEKRRG
jgi:hypothetical protein